MALISTIRKNSWILVVFIGLGLAGFILMDMASGDQSLFGANRTTMGEIEGRTIDYNEFNRLENLLYGGTASTDIYGNRNYIWNYLVEETLVQNEAEELGLGVSKEELLDLQFGNQLSPVIQQRFVNPQTGQVDRNQLNQIKQQIENNTLDPRVRSFWAHQEKEIVKERIEQKLANLVVKSVYTPSWLVRKYHNETNQKMTFQYVSVPFDEVDDTELNLTDADYEEYLEENEENYIFDEEQRKVAYVSYEVLPTAADSTKIRNEMENLIEGFETAEDDSLYVVNNYGTYYDAYQLKSDLSPVIADTVFEIPVGSIYGPYIDEGAYRAVKVLDRKMIPDSVRSRHILIRATTQEEFIRANAKIDSIKNLIETGASQFDSLAVQLSEDVASGAQGGDLDFAAPGQMVKPFNDMIFYQAEPGELNKVFTQFGVHLVEVTDRLFKENNMGVQLAMLSQPIIPSEDTQNELYQQATEFVSKNRTMEDLEAAVAENPDMEISISPGFKRNDFNIFGVATGQLARDMVRWAFASSTDIGDVSPEVYIQEDEVNYFNSKYYIIALNSILPEGKPTLASIKEEIDLLVKNQAKGEIIKEKIQGMDMASIARQYETTIDTATSVSFSTQFIGGIGQEPNVLGAIATLEIGDTSEPIIGNNGVYVLKLTDKTPESEPTNIAQLRRQAATSTTSLVRNNLIGAMVKNADIEDNRFTFY